MTQEEFIKVLDKKGYSYDIEGDKIIVNRKGGVGLGMLTSLPPGVVFRNGGDVYLTSLTSLPPGVEFSNEGIKIKLAAIYLNALIGGRFNDWKGNIEGIDSKRLLNKMIKDGVFER